MNKYAQIYIEEFNKQAGLGSIIASGAKSLWKSFAPSVVKNTKEIAKGTSNIVSNARNTIKRDIDTFNRTATPGQKSSIAASAGVSGALFGYGALGGLNS